MLSGGSLVTFVVTVLLFAYMPGPAMIYSAAQTIANGRRSGLMAAFGVHVGGYFHVILAAAGLSILLHAIPVVFIAVKAMGAIYLIWMGCKLVVGSTKKTVPTNGEIILKSPKKSFFDSVIVDVLNPKTAVFFLSFIPQFVNYHAETPIWCQFLILGTATNLIFSSADFVSVIVAHKLMAKLKGPSPWRDRLPKLGGAVLVLLGIHLLISE